MEKVDLRSLIVSNQISKSDSSNVFLLRDGSILKIFSQLSQLMYTMAGISLEGKIITAKKIVNVPEIVVPKSAVYDGKRFVGYITDYIEGINFNDWDDNLSLDQRCDLLMYAEIYKKIEDIVKRGNAKKIIFPDLLTCDNIIFTADGSVRFIDYDGLQIGNYNSVAISTTLGDESEYMNPKYCSSPLHFTQNLDKASLIYFYFISALGIGLFNVGKLDPRTGKPITLDDVFEVINLDDDDIKHKVWKCFQKNCINSFLGDDVFRIAEKYTMACMPIEVGGQLQFLKRLKRK